MVSVNTGINENMDFSEVESDHERQREAGKLYYEALEKVRADSQRNWMLAQHIKLMIEGTVNNRGPLWQSREVPPEGKHIELDKFEDYLLCDPRDGLGIPSLLHVHYHLRGEDKGEEAIALLRREISDYDTRIQREEAKRETKRARSNPQPTRSDAGAKGGRGNKAVGDTNSFHRNEGSSYYLRRLARDRPDLLSRVENGELTANAAAVEAGYRKRKATLADCSDDQLMQEVERRGLDKDSTAFVYRNAKDLREEMWAAVWDVIERAEAAEDTDNGITIRDALSGLSSAVEKYCQTERPEHVDEWLRTGVAHIMSRFSDNTFR